MRRSDPAPTACTTTAERLLCPCLKPTGYTEPGVEHRRCDTTGCGFGAFVSTRGPARPSYADWAQHERDMAPDVYEVSYG